MGLGVLQEVIYPLAPGICRVCGTNFGARRMVDTGLTGDFCNRPHWNPITEEVDAEVDMNLAGTVYFCESCVVNMAMIFGMMPEHKVQEMYQKINKQQETIINQTRKILGLEKMLDAYNTLGSVNTSTSADVESVGDSNESDVITVVETTSEGTLFDPGNTEGSLQGSDADGTDSGNSEANESSDFEGHDGLSRDLSSKSGNSGDESISDPSTSGGNESQSLRF